jgi:hypothetical protein
MPKTIGDDFVDIPRAAMNVARDPMQMAVFVLEPVRRLKFAELRA